MDDDVLMGEGTQEAALAEPNATAQNNTAEAERPTLPLLNDKEGEGVVPKAQNQPETPAYTIEDYDSVSVPDGLQVRPELMGEFKSIAAELKLPPEAAQRLMDLEIKNAQAQLEQQAQILEGWRKEIVGDPEFGGSKLPETTGAARLALKTYDPSGSLLTELTQTGYGNHPGIIRFLARVGKSLAEDDLHTSRGEKTETPKSLRDQLWPDSAMPS